MIKVSIIVGSDSDEAIVKLAAWELDRLKIPYEVRVFSAHRTPGPLIGYLQQAEGAGVKVFIAIAGMAAHLAGFIKAHTVKPVIGVPVAASLMGLDALLSSVQMPPGVPVATVAINGGVNAAILAAEILATTDKEIETALLKRRSDMSESVQRSNTVLNNNLKKESPL